jgi:RecB family exonuclease
MTQSGGGCGVALQGYYGLYSGSKLTNLRFVRMLLQRLAEIAREDLLARKLLVCRTRGEAREMLRSLARAGVPCIGFEATTTRDLAFSLAAGELAANNLEPVDEFTALALLEEATDAALASSESSSALRLIAEGAGFRDAVRRTVDALRLDGASPETLRSAGLGDAARAEALAEILNGYARRLFAAPPKEPGGERRRLADSTTIYMAANEALQEGRAQLPKARLLLAPTLDMRGLRGELVRALIAHGAEVLPHDAVAEPAPRTLLWGAAPHVRAASAAQAEMFSAASITDELREVLRRVMALSARWDEVEIIASDAVVYGCALDALATRLNVPVTYAVGLPLERTRVGRAVTGYLRWIREDFRADLLRNLFESGCLEAPHAPAISPMSLANRLRELRVGWDRSRYLPAIERSLASLDVRAALLSDDERESGLERAQSIERAKVELTVLGEVIGEILEATPEIGKRSGTQAEVSVADLARGLLALLHFVPITNKLEESACDALRRRLERAAQTLTRATSPRIALATLHERLNMRVPAVSAEEPPPWGSAGGHLHLSDIEHGGWTARPYTFIVGLDSGRFPGAITQDPLLTDEDRRRINAATAGGAQRQSLRALATSAERIDERRFLLESLLARLHNSVTLSYSAWDASEARKAAPASVLLQVFRLVTGNPHASYEELHASLGAPISAVPRKAARVDRTDVWLGALENGGVLREGTEVVRSAFPGLNQGLIARDARLSPELNVYSGRILPRVTQLDPRANHDILVSAKRIETLGTCPLRYLFAYVFGVKPPEDPEFAPDAWLNPLAKGSLLHNVFEIALREARRLEISVAEDGFEQLVCDILEAESRRTLDTLPAPSDGVYRRELQELKGDVHAFVEMVREDEPWLELELQFGYGARAVDFPLRGGSIRLQGRIDRIDEHEDGLLVLDYKTGSKYGLTWGKTFDGARRIQHALYMHAAHALLARTVIRMEYRFPTVKGRNDSARYDSHSVAAGSDMIAELLDLVAAGTFSPTDRADDCRFCDFRAVCRVTQDRSDKLVTPGMRLDQHRVRMDAFVALQDLRRRYV